MKIKIFSLLALIFSILLCFTLVSCTDDIESESSSVSQSQSEGEKETQSESESQAESESESQSQSQDTAVPKGIRLNKSELTLETGESKTLVSTVTPFPSANQEVIWSSSDKSIATVDGGRVTGIAEGAVTITATTVNGLSASCEVTVTLAGKYPKSITLDRTSINLEVGFATDLVATLSPDNVVENKITWSSSDTSIVGLGPDGSITGVSDGTAIVTATTVNGLTATCKVVVGAGKPITKIEISEPTKQIKVGDSYTLTTQLVPNNASTYGFTWESSDSDVLTVNSNGTIKARKAGTATITVTAKNGVKGEITITVGEAETFPVELYVDGKLLTTLYSTQGSSYTLKLPRPTDITTDSTSLKYFEGWYTSEEFTQKVYDSTTTFKTATKLYAKMTDVDVSSFNYTTDNGEITITGYNGTTPKTLIIPSKINNLPVVAVGESAFYANKVITKVIVCEGIKSIGKNAFASCSNLYDISIPSSLEELGMFAITASSQFFSLNRYNNVGYIGNDTNPYLVALEMESAYEGIIIELHKDCKIVAFRALEYFGLKNIRVEEGNEHLCAENGILYDINKTEIIEIANLLNKEIIIPKTVVSIPDNAFSNVKFTTISVEEGNTAYACEGGILYDIDKTKILCAPTSLEGKVTIPSTVSKIEISDFSGCSKITQIEFLGSITEIDLSTAFYGCDSLESISLPTSSAYSTQSGILYNADMSDILFVPKAIRGEITIPSAIKEISESLFLNCINITAIVLENGIEAIGNNAFNGCISVKTITIPSSVKTIGSYAFKNCESIEEISIPSGIKEISEGMLSYCYKLKSVSLPSSIESIGAAAFQGSSALDTISLPSGIKSIGGLAFQDCSALKTIALPSGLESLGASAFKYSGITEIELPSTIKSCDQGVFSNCKSLVSAKIPASLTAIPSNMFYNCSALVSVSIANGVEQISSFAFYNCTALKSITTPDSLKEISSSAFYNCKSLEQISLNEGVEVIGQRAFSNCHMVISITLPSTLTSVSSNAFSGCVRLVEIYNTSSVDMSSITINSITTIHTSKTEPSLISVVDDFVFVEHDSKYYLIGYKGALTSITLPSNYKSSSYIINDYALSGLKVTEVTIPSTVTKIGAYAFSGLPITKISIPDSVTEIASYAFSSCNSLEQISIGKGLVTLARYAFQSCKKVNKIYFDAVEMTDLATSNYVFHYIGDETDNGVSVIIGKDVKRVPSNLFNPYNTAGANVTSVVFEQGSVCTSIGERAFYRNNIKVLTLGGAIQTLEKGAFEDAGAITELILPSSLITIGEDAFNSTLSLEAITIPDSVKEIGDEAFASNFLLKSIVIGSGVEKIGRRMLSMCNNIESITFRNTQGWSVSTSTSGTNSVQVESSALADTANAVTLLKSTYLRYYWTRTVSE